MQVFIDEHLDDAVVRLDDLVLPEIDRAVLDMLEEIQAAQERALAGSARTADGDSLAVVDDQVESFEHRLRPVPDGHVFQAKKFIHTHYARCLKNSMRCIRM